MEKLNFLGLDVNKISLKELFLNKTMIFAYILLACAMYGIFGIYDLRYFSDASNAYAAGLDPSNPQLKEAIKLAIFGVVGEVNREIPWTLFIVNYMFMIYTGSGVIFLISLCEIFKIHIEPKVAANVMILGLCMVFAGLFTIATDLNMKNLQWMFLTPNFSAGMWLMLPLYIVYIPFVCFEIYLLLTKNVKLAGKIAFVILILSVFLDILEYYIQAKLFSMNTARAFWTKLPILPLYFIVSSFLAAFGILGIFNAIKYQNNKFFKKYNILISRGILAITMLLGAYEVLVYLSVDKEWVNIILFGPFKNLYFFGYALFALVLPFLLLVRSRNHVLVFIASICVLVGTYAGRYLFVYGGNANPMTNRFGMGYEKYDNYDISSAFHYASPHISEILIVIGSLGVILALYKVISEIFIIKNKQL